MKNKKLLAVLALTVTASVFMAGCGFGGDEPEDVYKRQVQMYGIWHKRI